MQTIVMPKDVEYKYHIDLCEALTARQPDFRVKATKFLNGTVDYFMTAVKYSLPRDEDKELTELTPEQLEEKRLENIERAARRAKQVIHHAVRQIEADHMLTLSTRENITDRDRFYGIYAKFINLIRTKDLVVKRQPHTGLLCPLLVTRKTKRDYPYVAVSELQERGAYHMHVACVGKQDLVLLRACWYEALGGKPADIGDATKGQIDVQFAKRRFSGFSEQFKTFKLVGYLCKYMGKSFEQTQELGLKRYSSSRSIPKVEKEYFYITWLMDYETGMASSIDALQELYRFAMARGFTTFEPWNRKGSEVYVLRASI